ncbi:hypothetical protein E2C01_032485 [Portunus trituberculatus]|uniref:Uncharacterized protein n=1 Tax=Portunus trituberculatus TaxID=210409 RepID=A0A5B7F0U4_PORTR|nr:hypothetical protein [Portunus trituberculatus]
MIAQNTAPCFVPAAPETDRQRMGVQGYSRHQKTIVILQSRVIASAPPGSPAPYLAWQNRATLRAGIPTVPGGGETDVIVGATDVECGAIEAASWGTMNTVGKIRGMGSADSARLSFVMLMFLLAAHPPTNLPRYVVTPAWRVLSVCSLTSDHQSFQSVIGNPNPHVINHAAHLPHFRLSINRCSFDIHMAKRTIRDARVALTIWH